MAALRGEGSVQAAAAEGEQRHTRHQQAQRVAGPPLQHGLGPIVRQDAPGGCQPAGAIQRGAGGGAQAAGAQQQPQVAPLGQLRVEAGAQQPARRRPGRTHIAQRNAHCQGDGRAHGQLQAHRADQQRRHHARAPTHQHCQRAAQGRPEHTDEGRRAVQHQAEPAGRHIGHRHQQRPPPPAGHAQQPAVQAVGRVAGRRGMVGGSGWWCPIRGRWPMLAVEAPPRRTVGRHAARPGNAKARLGRAFAGIWAPERLQAPGLSPAIRRRNLRAWRRRPEPP